MIYSVRNFKRPDKIIHLFLTTHKQNMYCVTRPNHAVPSFIIPKLPLIDLFDIPKLRTLNCGHHLARYFPPSCWYQSWNCISETKVNVAYNVVMFLL
jgi:hypothetical protein